MLDNLFGACKVHNIPVLLIVPANLHENARKILGDIGPNVRIVPPAPEELEAQIRKHL